MNYLPHEIANIFPMMTPDEFVSLKADIKERGLKNPVIMFEEKILDGRNRFKACQEAGVKIQTVNYDGNDALADVISWNLKRRHLNESQRGMVAARLANMNHGGDRKQVNQVANLQDVSRSEAAKMLNVSERTVNSAKRIQKSAIPELIEKVEQGVVSVSAASSVAKLGKNEQEVIINEINLGAKPSEAINRVKSADEIIVPHSTALQFSTIAISQLSRIRDNDIKRIEALNIVLDYIKQQLKQD